MEELTLDNIITYINTNVSNITGIINALHEAINKLSSQDKSGEPNPKSGEPNPKSGEPNPKIITLNDVLKEIENTVNSIYSSVNSILSNKNFEKTRILRKNLKKLSLITNIIDEFKTIIDNIKNISSIDIYSDQTKTIEVPDLDEKGQPIKNEDGTLKTHKEEKKLTIFDVIGVNLNIITKGISSTAKSISKLQKIKFKHNIKKVLSNTFSVILEFVNSISEFLSNTGDFKSDKINILNLDDNRFKIPVKIKIKEEKDLLTGKIITPESEKTEYKNIFDIISSSIGIVVKAFQASLKTTDSLGKIKFSKQLLKNNIKNIFKYYSYFIDAFIKYGNSFTEQFKNIEFIAKISDQLNIINNFYTKSNDTIAKLLAFKFKNNKRQIKQFVKYINNTYNILFTYFSEFVDQVIILNKSAFNKNKLKILNNFFSNEKNSVISILTESIKSLITFFNKFNLKFLIQFLSLKVVKPILKAGFNDTISIFNQFKEFINNIPTIDIKNSNNPIIKIDNIKSVFESLGKLFEIIFPFAAKCLVIIPLVPIIKGGLLAIKAILWIVNKMFDESKSTEETNNQIVLEKNIENIKNILKSLQKLTISILLFATSCLVIIPVSPIIILGLLAIKGILFVVNLFVKSLTNLKSMEFDLVKINLLFKSLNSISLNLIVFAITSAALILVSPIIIGGILIIYVILKTIKLLEKVKFSPTLFINLLVLIGLIAIITLAATLLFIFGKINLWKESLHILANVGIVIGISLMIAGFGMLLGMIPGVIPLLGLATITISLLLAPILLMTIAGGLLILLGRMDLESIQEPLENNIKIISESINSIIIYLSGGSLENKNGKKKSLVGKIFQGMGGVFNNIFQLINSLILFPRIITMIMITGSIWAIAAMLQQIAKMEIDSSEIENKIKDIGYIISNLFIWLNEEPAKNAEQNAEQEPEKKTWFGKVLQGIGKSLANFVGAINNLVALPKLISSIALLGGIKSIVKILKKISKFNIDETSIATSMQNIFKVVDTVITNLKAYDVNNIDGAKKKLRKIKNLIKLLKKIIKNLNVNTNSANNIISTDNVTNIFSVIETTITEIQKYKENDIENVKSKLKEIKGITQILKRIFKNLSNTDLNQNISTDNIKKVIDSLLKIPTIQTGKTYLDYLKDLRYLKIKKINKVVSTLNSVVEDIVKIEKVDNTKLKNNIEPLTAFIDKISNADLDKLKEASSIFKEISNFSKSINGNFQELAETINEKIAPLLEKLQESIQDINKSSPIAIKEEISTNSIDPVLSKKDKKNAIIEKENTSSSSIEYQLSEILRILEEKGIRIRMI